VPLGEVLLHYRFLAGECQKNLRKKIFYKNVLFCHFNLSILGNMRIKVIFFVFGAVGAPPDKTRYRRDRLIS